MSKSFHIELGAWRTSMDAVLTDMAQKRIVARLWNKEYRLWKSEPTEIENRLGWLTVAEQMQERLGALQTFAKSVRDEGFRHVVLLGMGGSSLGPEVLRHTFAPARGFPKLIVLDSTVPTAVREVAQAIHPARTAFIVASKSGGTIEVMSLFAYFRRLVARTKGNNVGRQFIAITDPGTSLVSLAHEHGFRTTFINPADIGGRYSVLSYFGLVPAVLLGLDLETFLQRAVDMGRACGSTEPIENNPGALLGAVLAGLAKNGRDKVTILASPQVATFGLWAEQLLAESTGKEGAGLIPIAQEPPARPSAYGSDRLFVYLHADGDANGRLDRHVIALQRAGHPVVRLRLKDRYDLGAEFFRWEFATAIAGHYLGIHPFDQPNVQESKENTARILETVRERGRLPTVQADTRLNDLLAKAIPGSYVAILAYLNPSRRTDVALSLLRKTIMEKWRLATTAGYGPRYLHSTGQLHKGGPSNGLYLQLIGDMAPDITVPEAGYSFGILAQAQAVGDLQSLQAHHRPVVRIKVGGDIAADIRRLVADLIGAPRHQPGLVRRRRR